MDTIRTGTRKIPVAPSFEKMKIKRKIAKKITSLSSLPITCRLVSDSVYEQKDSGSMVLQESSLSIF